jgi:hypothetical protein
MASTRKKLRLKKRRLTVLDLRPRAPVDYILIIGATAEGVQNCHEVERLREALAEIRRLAYQFGHQLAARVHRREKAKKRREQRA